MNCAICMENIQNIVTKKNKIAYHASTFMLHNNVKKTLRCKHSFHKKCIDKWFEKSYTCPICRCIDTSPYKKPSLVVRVYSPGGTEITYIY